MPKTSAQESQVYIEFIQVGNSVKVSAICADTGREVSIVGSPKASKAELTRVAVNKLRYVLAKERK